MVARESLILAVREVAVLIFVLAVLIWLGRELVRVSRR
jgi:hypothetical protein